MKRYLILSLLALAGLVALSCADHGVGPSYVYGQFPLSDNFSWRGSGIIWENAADKKPLSMMVVCTSWCGYCRLLKSGTLCDSTVMGLIDKYYNACIIDADSDSLITYCDSTLTCEQVADSCLNVRGYPTTIFFNSKGTEIYRLVGYYDAKPFADLLWRVYAGLR